MKKIQVSMVVLAAMLLVLPISARELGEDERDEGDQEVEARQRVGESQEVSGGQKSVLMPYSGNFTLDIKVAPGFAWTLYGRANETEIFGILSDIGTASGPLRALVLM